MNLTEIRIAIQKQDNISEELGNEGEQFALLHFLTLNEKVIHVHQSFWSKPERMIEMNAQRPDFFLYPMGEKITAIDVKHHHLGKEMLFIMPNDAIIKYKNLINYLVEYYNVLKENIRLQFMIFPVELKGLAYAQFDFDELLSDNYKSKIESPGNITDNIHMQIIPIKDRLIKIYTKNEPFDSDEFLENQEKFNER